MNWIENAGKRPSRKKKTVSPLFSLLAVKRRKSITGIKGSTVVLEKKATPEKKPEKKGKSLLLFFKLRLRKKRLKRIRKKLEL